MNPTTWHHPAARIVGRAGGAGMLGTAAARRRLPPCCRRPTRAPATWRSPRPKPTTTEHQGVDQ